MPKRYREDNSGYTVITRSQTKKKQRIEDLAQDEGATFYQSDSSLEADLIIPKERDSYYLEIDTLEQNDYPTTDGEIDLSIDDSSSENDSFLSEEEPRIKKLTKEKILKFLESVLHINLEKTVLADIVFSEKGNELTIVGRGKLDGTAKQLNHIIPVLFIKNTIQAALETSTKPEDVIQYLSKNIVTLARSQQGFAITQSQLETEEYKEIASKAQSLADRTLLCDKQKVHFFSPGKKQKLFKTPTKKEIAEKTYPLFNSQYINKALQLFKESIKTNDENTLTITCEALARFILIMSNKGENISFASAGNTLPYEIRLYDNPEDTIKSTMNYKVVKPRELKDKTSDDISKCVRIVNCEGTDLQKISLALKSLDDIFNNYILHDRANEDKLSLYNKKNIKLKLSNNPCDISRYNNELTPDNYLSDIYYHIAKQLYLAFHLKALEHQVFAPAFPGASNTVTVYTSAGGKNTSEYVIMNGDQYREFEIRRDIEFNDNSFFRNKERDQTILPKKLAELFIIGTMIFKNFDNDITYLQIKPLVYTLKLLADLAALDYELDQSETENLENQVLEHYQSWCTDVSESNIEILPLGDNDFSEIFV